MRLPHEQYVRFLITLNFDFDDTQDYLADHALLKLKKAYWEDQKAILETSKVPKYIKSFWVAEKKTKLPKDFIRYMNTVGLQDAWLYNLGKCKEFGIALDALKDIDVSICVRSLLAMSVAAEEISALVNGKFGMSFPKKSVELFRKYFFQPLIMSRASWRNYLNELIPEEKHLIYLGITGQQTVLRAELGLPVKISVADHYQKLHIFAMQKFELYKKTNSPDADQNALKWAQMAMSSGDKYEKLKIGDAADFGRDIQMEFDFIDTDFPMIGEENLDEIRQHDVDGQNNDEASPIPVRTEP
jgi:hypothetical protein